MIVHAEQFGARRQLISLREPRARVEAIAPNKLTVAFDDGCNRMTMDLRYSEVETLVQALMDATAKGTVQ